MTAILALTLSSALSAAPPPAEPRTLLVTQAVRIADARASLPARRGIGRASVTPPGGDSLKNGAIIGAIAAGAATVAVLGYFCHVFNETDESCFWPVAWRTAVAAAGGAAAGAGIDALFARAPSVRMRVRF